MRVRAPPSLREARLSHMDGDGDGGSYKKRYDCTRVGGTVWERRIAFDTGVLLLQLLNSGLLVGETRRTKFPTRPRAPTGYTAMTGRGALIATHRFYFHSLADWLWFLDSRADGVLIDRSIDRRGLNNRCGPCVCCKIHMVAGRGAQSGSRR